MTLVPDRWRQWSYLLQGSDLYFYVDRPSISRDGGGPPAASKFVLRVYSRPRSDPKAIGLEVIDSRDLASHVNESGEETLINTLLMALTLAGHEVYLDDVLFSEINQYIRTDQWLQSLNRPQKNPVR